MEDRIFGEPGNYDFDSIRVDGLGEICDQAVGMSVRGVAWTDLLEVARAIRLTRVMLKRGQFTEAWTFMQALYPSKGWSEVVGRLADNTADESVAEVLRSSVDELRSYDSEILHARSMRDIAAALAIGGIRDEKDDFSTDAVDAKALQAELDAKVVHLILTDTAKRLVEDCKSVIKTRSLALSAQWSDLEALIVPLHGSTAAFGDCHPATQAELKLYYDKVYDLKVQKQLHDTIAADKLTLVQSTVDVRCDTSLLSARALKDCIAHAQSGFVLSRQTLGVLSLAKGLNCLRSAVLQDTWEPSSRFFFGSTPTQDLVSLFGKLGTDPTLAKAKAALESTIGRLDRLESEIPLEMIANSVAETDSSKLSLSEIVSYLRKSESAVSLIDDELQVAERLNNDRRCRLLLLLSASTGMIQGSLDDFDCSAVVTYQLEVALAYVDPWGSPALC